MIGFSELLQTREKEIFETLKELKNRDCHFVLIGGYAVNAYTLPRFSVDCDVVVEGIVEAKKVDSALKSLGYTKATESKIFMRYGKALEKELKVAVDVLIGEVFDRQTGASFPANWVFKHSSLQTLRGKTIIEKLELPIINVDALVALKFVAGRTTDIRDIFMLLPLVRDLEKLKEEISLKAGFKGRFAKIKEKITSAEFRKNLQGVYGFIDGKIFEKHKKAVVELGNVD